MVVAGSQAFAPGMGTPRCRVTRFGSAEGRSHPRRTDVEMVAGGVRYAYHVELDNAQVLYEALHSYPERRRRILFERDGLDIEFRRGLGDSLARESCSRPPPSPYRRLCELITQRFNLSDLLCLG